MNKLVRQRNQLLYESQTIPSVTNRIQTRNFYSSQPVHVLSPNRQFLSIKVNFAWHDRFSKRD